MAEARKRRRGDRKEGRWLRSLPGLTAFIPYIMPTRNDATNLYEESFEISEVDRYLRSLRVQGYTGIGLLHFLIATHIRCLSELPALNRFVVGRRIYARNNIEVIMMVKRDMTLEGEETDIKVVFEPTDTIIDVYNKINAAIDEVKNGPQNGTENFANLATRLPRWLLRFVILILRVMDYYGLLPQSLMNISPFHGSMILTDLGSLRIGPVFHHIYNFGTLPVFIAFGAKRTEMAPNRKGEIVRCKYLDMKMTLDERVADGMYFARFLQRWRQIFANPAQLSDAPETVVEDVD